MEEDKFTPGPQRRSRTSTRSSSPVRTSSRRHPPVSADNHRDPRDPRTPQRRGSKSSVTGPRSRGSAHIFPASPPLLTSNKLDTMLFFGGDVHGKGKSLPSAPTSRIGDAGAERVTVIKSPVLGSGPMTMGGLPTTQPLRLNADRSEDDDPRAKFKLASSAASMSASEYTAMSPASPVSPPLSPRARSPAERYHARHGALDKVKTIVRDSWTERDIRGLSRPTSPTAFGAVASPDPNISLDFSQHRPTHRQSPQTRANGASPKKLAPRAHSPDDGRVHGIIQRLEHAR
jgi:hypothetical protein